MSSILNLMTNRKSTRLLSPKVAQGSRFYLLFKIMGVKTKTNNCNMGLKGKDYKEVREKKDENLTKV